MPDKEWTQFLNVRACISNATHPENLYEVIRLACIASSITAVVAGAKKIPSAKNLLQAMTRQEIKVLRVMAAGLSNDEIAQRLHISVRTVEGHRSNIYQKTGTRNLAAVIRYALRNELVTLIELDKLII